MSGSCVEYMARQDKVDYFHDKVRKRHLRLGLIGETRMSVPGDVTTTQLVDTDNDGLWTSFYMGSEIFRYAATGNRVARARSEEHTSELQSRGHLVCRL